MFVFVILDSNKNEVLCWNRFSIKPLYYLNDGNQFGFFQMLIHKVPEKISNFKFKILPICANRLLLLNEFMKVKKLPQPITYYALQNKQIN